MTQPLYHQIVQKNVPQGKLGLWPLGGGSIAVRSRKILAFVDPFLSNWSSEDWVRRFPPVFAPQAVDTCNLILLTHEHDDHCDPATIRPILQNCAPLLVGPLAAVNRLDTAGVFNGLSAEVRTVGPGEQLQVGDLKIQSIVTHDPLSQGAVGYLVQSGNTSVLFLGDSLFVDTLLEELSNRHRVDLFVVALGANTPEDTYYFSIDDVASAARIVHPTYVLPIHWDLWTKTFIDPKTHLRNMPDNVILVQRGEFLFLPLDSKTNTRQ